MSNTAERLRPEDDDGRETNVFPALVLQTVPSESPDDDQARGDLVVIATYTLAFVFAEVLSLVDVRVHVWGLAVLAVAGLSHAARGADRRRNVGLVIGALVVCRLFAAMLPFANLSLQARSAAVGLCSLFVFHLARRVMRDEPARPPIRSTNRWHLRGLLATTSIVVSLFAFLSTHHTDTVSPAFGSLGLAYALAVIGLGFGALGEELLYRRLAARMVRVSTRFDLSMLPPLLWAATFAGNRNLALVALAAVMGFVFSRTYERTGSIKGQVIAHAAINIATLLVLPSLL